MIEINNNWPVVWTSYTKYVDLATGQEITKHMAETQYIKIKTKKNATLNANETKGTVEYTIECRRNPQTSIW